MELKFDIEKFDELQAAFIEEIVRNISVKLAEAGLSGVALEEATMKVANSVAGAIDDMANIEVDGVEVKPYLTFRGEGDEELIHCGENSATYEFVIPALEKVFA